MEPPLFHTGARRMLCADRIVRAQHAHTYGEGEMIFDVSRLLYQSAERSVCVWTAGEQQNSESLRLCVRIDSFTDGTRRIAATHRDGLNQEVRERMQ